MEHLPQLGSMLAPLHLLFYSTLLGTELYQSFVITKVCFEALPRSAFTTLQKRVFPLYFRGQSLLLLFAAATAPPHGPTSLWKSKGDWIPFVVAGVTAALNLGVYGPRTRKAMIDRIHQEMRDQRRLDGNYGAAGTGHIELSPEMRALNKVFSRNHAICIHLNLVSMGAMLFYGCRLAERLSG